MLTLWKEAPQEVKESAKQHENFEASLLFLFCFGACILILTREMMPKSHSLSGRENLVQRRATFVTWYSFKKVTKRPNICLKKKDLECFFGCWKFRIRKRLSTYHTELWQTCELKKGNEAVKIQSEWKRKRKKIKKVKALLCCCCCFYVCPVFAHATVVSVFHSVLDLSFWNMKWESFVQ